MKSMKDKKDTTPPLGVLAAKKIILIGMMGTGKTTVSQAIAEKYNYKFIDTDNLIEERNPLAPKEPPNPLKGEQTSNLIIPISEIINKYGIEKFRNLETEVLKEIVNSYSPFRGLGGYIISTGGGIVLREENRKILKSLGKIIWLDLAPEKILERIKNDQSRPLLESNSHQEKLEKITKILDERYEIYKSIADLHINVEDLTTEQIIQYMINVDPQSI